MKDFLIHYEEYGDNDYVLTITPDIMVKYFIEIGYSQSKSQLIVGALEKLAYFNFHGFAELMDEDVRFYHWAKDYCRRKAEKQFGYEGYLVVYQDENGEYQETLSPTFYEAERLFTHCHEQNLPAGVLKPKAMGYGWCESPIKKTKWQKIEWRFWRNHKKGALRK